MILKKGVVSRPGFPFQATARGFLLAILVYAPWAYGSTRLWTMELLHEAAAACLVLHLIGLALEGRAPRWPALPVACLAILLAETAWMAFNAQSYYDQGFWEFVPLTQPFPGLPGSCDRGGDPLLSRTAGRDGRDFPGGIRCPGRAALETGRARNHGAGGCVDCDLRADAAGARRAFHLLAAGRQRPDFFQHLRLSRKRRRVPEPRIGRCCFLARCAVSGTPAPFGRTLWSSGLFLTLVACAVNVSRAAGAITIVLGLLAAVGLAPLGRRSGLVFPFWKVALGGVAALVFVALLFMEGLAGKSGNRWEHLIGGPVVVGDSRFQRLMSYGGFPAPASDLGLARLRGGHLLGPSSPTRPPISTGSSSAFGNTRTRIISRP